MFNLDIFRGNLFENVALVVNDNEYKFVELHNTIYYQYPGIFS